MSTYNYFGGGHVARKVSEVGVSGDKFNCSSQNVVVSRAVDWSSRCELSRLILFSSQLTSHIVGGKGERFRTQWPVVNLAE